MARRKTSQSGLEIIIGLVVLVVMAVVSGLVALWEFLVETKLIWFVPFLIIGGVVLWLYLKKKKEKERIQEINKHLGTWGKSYCDWLIINKYNLNDERISKVSNKVCEWGEEIVKNLIIKRIGIGMTDEMVFYSLGRPTNVDMKEISEKGEKFRWVYGVPRQGASYIWFKDKKVTKIKT
jgi:hypothetical protein